VGGLQEVLYRYRAHMALIWWWTDESLRLSIAHMFRDHVVLIQPSDRQYNNIHIHTVCELYFACNSLEFLLGVKLSPSLPPALQENKSNGNRDHTLRSPTSSASTHVCHHIFPAHLAQKQLAKGAWEIFRVLKQPLHPQSRSAYKIHPSVLVPSLTLA
jgi:hypothetical protein